MQYTAMLPSELYHLLQPCCHGVAVVHVSFLEYPVGRDGLVQAGGVLTNVATSGTQEVE